MLFAVDPGVEQCGVALFSSAWDERDARLMWVQFQPSKKPLLRLVNDAFGPVDLGGGLPECICELPEQRGRSTNVRMSDIIALTWAGSRVCANLPAETVRPSVWKGQVPKAIHHKRMEAALTPEERIVLQNCLRGVAKSVQHNLKDAVALGLWKLGRLGRGAKTE